MIRNGNSVHPMNRELSRMARRSDVIHDVDCIYRNTAKDFWLMIEWKNPGETVSSQGTTNSLQQMDEAFANASAQYKGWFIIRLGFSIDSFPLDDDQQLEVVHMHDGVVLEGKSYASGAQSAIQHILDHGRLL